MVRHSASVMVMMAALAGCSDVTLLDERGDTALLQTSTTAVMPESDHAPSHTMVVATADGRELHLQAVRAAALWPRVQNSARVVAVDDSANLIVTEGDTHRVLLDGVIGAPVVVDATRVIAARQTEPGESDLWIVTDDGAPPRALAPAPGPDDGAVVLADGRVLFVSGRSGVASLWIVDASPKADPRQLTNADQKQGALTSSFVPSPVGPVTEADGAVVYDAGDGVLWRVSVDTGAAARISATKGVR